MVIIFGNALIRKIYSGFVHICTIAFLVVLPNYSYSQNSNPSYDSFQKAQEIVYAGIQATGGFQNIGSIKDFNISYKQFESLRGQNLNPEAPDVLVEGSEAHLMYDAKTGFSRSEQNLQRRGRLFNPIIVIKKDQGFFYWPETQELHPSINVELIKKLFSFRFIYPQRFIPYLLLQNCIANNETLRWLGCEPIQGIDHDIVSFTDSEGLFLTLYFNSETHLLTKSEELFDDFISGDAIGEVYFKDYQLVKGVQFPMEFISRVSGTISKKMLVSNIAINTDFSPDIFELPKDIVPSEYPKIFTPQKIADDVYFVPLFNGTGISYNSLFVVFDDYVLVMDAPLSDLLSRYYSGLISRIAPNKPIKYVVPTHYHIDHSGGIKKFALDGTTIVTTKGNKKFFEDVIFLRRSIKPANRTNDNNIHFEIVEKKKVFKDNNHIIEIYDVGPNAHADEVLIAYLPKEKILYVTDLFWGTLTNHLPPARITLTEFVNKIDELGLEVKIIAPGHGKVSSVEDLEEAVKIVKE